MINIMCFGDSNTYGIDPVTGARLGRKDRWPGILQELLGSDYYVIEEGLAGRTSVWQDPLAENRCGLTALPMLLDSHSPLDLIIIMLGNNDFKHQFAALPEDAAAGIAKLVRTIRYHVYKQQKEIPQIFLLSPIVLTDNVENSRYGGFRKEAAEYSRKLPGLIKQVAEENQCWFFETGTVAEPDPADQHHMNRAAHHRLARAAAEIIKKKMN